MPANAANAAIAYGFSASVDACRSIGRGPAAHRWQEQTATDDKIEEDREWRSRSAGARPYHHKPVRAEAPVADEVREGRQGMNQAANGTGDDDRKQHTLVGFPASAVREEVPRLVRLHAADVL